MTIITKSTFSQTSLQHQAKGYAGKVDLYSSKAWLTRSLTLLAKSFVLTSRVLVCSFFLCLPLMKPCNAMEGGREI